MKINPSPTDGGLSICLWFISCTQKIWVENCPSFLLFICDELRYSAKFFETIGWIATCGVDFYFTKNTDVTSNVDWLIVVGLCLKLSLNSNSQDNIRPAVDPPQDSSNLSASADGRKSAPKNQNQPTSSSVNPREGSENIPPAPTRSDTHIVNIHESGIELANQIPEDVV
ncbi:uncharacterized protein G2W53_017881 [Senna tora]|uniref:Uncharacterized protein n=1 Tax=Senna tora TaxID=362788 RepID=A0A834WKV8_9FABA|nr:uncharacterized protein G2W53_017881 [Senna tora]